MNQEIVQRGVEDLKTDVTNGASILAIKAVKCLHNALSDTESDLNVLKTELRRAGYALATARPSMGAPITSAITSALEAIWEAWAQNVPEQDRTELPSPSPAVAQAKAVLDSQLHRRRETSQTIASNFANWLRSLPSNPDRPLNLLTLSSSSTLRACLLAAAPASSLPTAPSTTSIALHVLESRPANEGAAFAAALLASPALRSPSAGGRLSISLAPDSHVALLARAADAVLLGADRISAAGDVSNKTGSLAAAVCANAFGRPVVVVTETDKIAPPGGMQAHGVEEGPREEVVAAWRRDVRDGLDAVEVRNVVFEWVPASFVDVYVMETGVVGREEIGRLSERKAELERRFFEGLARGEDRRGG